MLNLHALTTVNPMSNRGLVRYTQHFAGARWQILAALILTSSAVAAFFVPAAQTALSVVAVIFCALLVAVYLGNLRLVSVDELVIADLVDLRTVLDPSNPNDRAVFEGFQAAAIEHTRRVNRPGAFDLDDAAGFELRKSINTEIITRRAATIAPALARTA